MTQPPPPSRQALPAPPVPPSPLPERLAAAQEAFAEGKDDLARKALLGVSPQEEAGWPQEACTVYRVLSAALDASARSLPVPDFRAALEANDLPRLAAMIRALSPEERRTISAAPATRRSFAAARQAAELFGRYQKAVQAGEPGEILDASGAVATAYPRFKDAADRREKAAAQLEAEAETLLQTGAVGAALERLETLRHGWPDRPGLAEKIARYSVEERSDQGMAGVLTAVAAAEARKRPDEGLALLQASKPSPRFAARFREAQKRLEAELAQLDRNPPVLELAASTASLEYEKGSPARIPLKVTDDFAVRSVTVRVRPEGGAWSEVPCVRTGTLCTVEVPPALHQNRTIELYAVASDLSGHKTQLGSAEKPLLIRRKHWYDRLRGNPQPGQNQS